MLAIQMRHDVRHALVGVVDNDTSVSSIGSTVCLHYHVISHIIKRHKASDETTFRVKISWPAAREIVRERAHGGQVTDT